MPGTAAGGRTDAEALGRLADSEGDVDDLHPEARASRQAEPGRRDEEVEQPVAAVPCPMDEHEATCAGTRQRALGNPRDARRGHARVDRVAAELEHARTRLGRARVPRRNRTSHPVSVGAGPRPALSHGKPDVGPVPDRP